jgi:hypothetical protein
VETVFASKNRLSVVETVFVSKTVCFKNGSFLSPKTVPKELKVNLFILKIHVCGYVQRAEGETRRASNHTAAINIG